MVDMNVWVLLVSAILTCCVRTHGHELKDDVRQMVEEILTEQHVANIGLKSEVARLGDVVQRQEIRIRGLENTIMDIITGKVDVQGLKVTEKYEYYKEPKSKINITRKGGPATKKADSKDKRKQSYISRIPEHKRYSRNALGSSKRNLLGKRQTPGLAISASGLAFSAYLDHEITHLGKGHTVKYNQLILNDGNAYNTHTGVFTAPLTGVYLFTYHYCVVLGRTDLALMVDNKPIADASVDHGGDIKDLMGGNSVVVKVLRGQSVWIETAVVTDQEIRASSTYHKVTFSGVLLYETE